MSLDDQIVQALKRNPCPEADCLAAFLEEKLSIEEKERVEVHLQDCQACARIVNPSKPNRSLGFMVGIAASLLLITGITFFMDSVLKSPAKVSDSPRFRGGPKLAALRSPHGNKVVPRPVFRPNSQDPVFVEIIPLDANGAPGDKRFTLQLKGKPKPWPKAYPNLKEGAYLCMVEGPNLVSYSFVFRVKDPEREH